MQTPSSREEEIRKIIKENFSNDGLSYVSYISEDSLDATLDGMFDLQILADDISALIEKSLSHERKEWRERAEKLKMIRQPLSASESACPKCGFSNDHRVCMCPRNEGIEAVLALLDKGE